MGDLLVTGHLESEVNEMLFGCIIKISTMAMRVTRCTATMVSRFPHLMLTMTTEKGTLQRGAARDYTKEAGGTETVTMLTSTAGTWGAPTGPSLTGSTGTPGP